jgi:hypothetical protein
MSARLLVTAFALLSSVWSGGALAENGEYCQHSEHITLIFVDRTTQYDEIDKELFVSGFDRIVGTLKPGDRVAVHTLAGDYPQSERVFDRCVPGCPDSGVLGWIFSSCRPMQARVDFSRFRQDLAASIRRMLDELQSYEHSDIVRTLARVTEAVARSGTDQERSRQLRHVFIFSDLLENSKHLPWPTIIRRPSSDLVGELSRNGLIPIVRGARVVAFGIGRSHDPERTALGTSAERRLQDFWALLFATGGAEDVYIGRRLD